MKFSKKQSARYTSLTSDTRVFVSKAGVSPRAHPLEKFSVFLHSDAPSFLFALIIVIFIGGFLFIRYNSQIQNYYTKILSASPDNPMPDSTQSTTPSVGDSETQQNSGGVTGEEIEVPAAEEMVDYSEAPYEGDYGAEEDSYIPEEEFMQNPEETGMDPGFEGEGDYSIPPDESEGAQPMTQ